MAERDYYDILGVARDADLAQIKKAYKRVAMKYHPDRNRDDGSSERFKEAGEAWAVLSDPKKRRAYDQFGRAGVDRQGGFGGIDLGDIFSDVFGDIFGGGAHRRRRRGDDLQYTQRIDLEQAASGARVSLRVPTRTGCQACSGSGSRSGRTQTCAACDGHGQLRVQQGYFSIQQTCPQCGGSGERIADPCTACDGRGMVDDSKTLAVKIPKGVNDGDRIRLPGEGRGDPGQQAGDLYVQIEVRPHPQFRRDGADLHTAVPVSFADAALGATVEVPTLDGKVRLKVPPGTQPGKLLRINGRGMPTLRGGRGDLYAEVAVRVPTGLSSAQRKLLQQLRDSLD